MRIITLVSTALVMMLFPVSAMAGISDNNKLKGGDSLLIGGTQPGWIEVDGQNRGATPIELSIRAGDKVKELGIVQPGKGFYESVRKNHVFVIRNVSPSEPAKVYWHVSRYSKTANARIEARKD